MEQVFSIGHQIWSFFQTLFSPSEYPELIQQGWPVVAGVGVMLMLVLFLRGRQGKMVRRQQLEALEEALLDDDPEDRSLELPDPPVEEDPYGDDPDGDDLIRENEEDPVPEPLRRTLARDPEFGGQIVIAANSSRKSSNEPEPETQPENDEPTTATSSIEDIDQEFAQFAQELKEKAKEVQRRHQIEDGLMENELFEEDFETEGQAEPIALSAADIVEDDREDSSDDWNQELEDLLEQPELTDRLEDEEIPGKLTADTERDPLEIQERNEDLIRRLEEFQKDFEHRLQSKTLSQLAQKNFELVESLSDSEQTRGYQEMKRNQMESISTLESMVFGSEKKKR